MENKKDYTKWKKISIIVIMTILLIGMLAGAFAYTPQTTFIDKFPIQVMPKVNGYMKPNTQFDYTFIFAEDENCVDDLFTKSITITTDAYGVGATTLDLSTMDGIPSYLCEYRDGSLRAVHPLNERMFITQITEQDIEDYGFIKIDTNTQLNESQVDAYVSNNGYLKNETDPTITLQKLQNLTFNDYHNLGGDDRVLNKSEIEDMGFSTIDNDYCSNGVCGGDLTINGDLKLIGSITNVNVTNVKSNGSIVPDYNSVFDLGSNLNKWNNVFANTLYGNIDYSQIQNVPTFLLTETDPQVTSTINGQWCRGTGSAIACDVTPVVDTKLTDSDIFTMGYIKSWTETDPIYASSSASTITATDIFNWNNAFSWGNHQNAGYITDPDDAVDSNELDNLCNQNGMILKRINNTWGCSSDIGFIPTSLLVDYNFTDNSIDWNKVYNDYYNNTNGYLTSYTETDPIFIGSPSYSINNSEISNWNLAYSWGNHNTQGYLKNETDPIYSTSASASITNSNISDWNEAYSWGNHGTFGYLTSETDPIFSSSASSNISNYDISNWNTAFSWGDHSIQGYLKNETDPLYIADKNGIVFYIDTINWDTNISDDFDGQWSSLNAIPVGFLDGVDNDTKYYNLSEFTNDVGYITGFNETDPLYSISPSSGISQLDIDNWNNVYNQINSGGNSSVVFEDDTTLWDKNVSDDFDGQWSSLLNIPTGFADGIDDDTTYSDLSEFNNDVGYYKSGDSPNFNDIETNSISVGGKSVCLEDGTNCQQVLNNSQIYNPKYVNIKDEFLGDSVENGELGELGWTIDHHNGATIFYEESDLSDIATHPAVVTCSDDWSWKAGCTYSLGESFVLNGGETFGYVVQSTQLSGTIKKFGMTDRLSNPNSDIDDGVYMVMSDSDSTIIGYVERSDSISSCDTGVTINDYTWYQLEMKVNENANGVDFYVNDVYRCSVNTQLPSNSIGPKALGYYSSNGINEDIFKIDLFYMTYELPNNRWD